VTLLAQLAALLAIVSTGVVYGTDAFCALAQRPALARVDDATLTAVMGNVHRYGDRRMAARWDPRNHRRRHIPSLRAFGDTLRDDGTAWS
jgi:hypothetical protein